MSDQEKINHYLDQNLESYLDDPDFETIDEALDYLSEDACAELGSYELKPQIKQDAYDRLTKT